MYYVIHILDKTLFGIFGAVTGAFLPEEKIIFVL